MEPTWMTLAFLHCVLDLNSVLDIRRSPLPPMSVLLLLAIFPGSGRVTSAQRLPGRDEELFQYQMRHKEVFYDTRLLPDGVEKKVFLPRNETERFYFLVKEEGSPLSLTLTPCTLGLIQWRLLYQEYPSTDTKTGNHPGAVDELLRQGVGVSHDRGQIYVVMETQLRGSSPRTTYAIGQTIPGLYTLVLSSDRQDASLQLYGTTTLESRPHPELPMDPHVRSVLGAGHTVMLSWKPSPSDVLHRQPVQYCVSVNQVRHLYSQCAALTFTKGDRQELPPHVGFGFPWERTYRNISIRADRQHATYTCIGTKSSFLYDAVSPGLRYYFDVFVVNTKLNTSSSYIGTSQRIKVRNAKQLKDGKIRSATVEGPDTKNFTFKLRKKPKELFVTVQTCTDPAFAKVSRHGRVLNSSVVLDNGITIITYRNARKGTYILTVSALAESTRIRVSYSTAKHGVPYPTIPHDSRVHVITNKTTCDSMTLSWAVGEDRQQHCIYVQKVSSENQLAHSELHDSSNCLSKRRRKKKNHKIRCVRFHAGHGDSHQETINNLQPNSLYAIHVYAAKHLQEWLSYKHVYARTSIMC